MPDEEEKKSPPEERRYGPRERSLWSEIDQGKSSSPRRKSSHSVRRGPIHGR